MTDNQEWAAAAAGTVGCGCVIPALTLIGFVWTVAKIFGWAA